MRRISFSGPAFAQYNDWVKTDKKVFERLNKLLQETARTPFDGTGKPEPLKQEFSGFWSRRTTHPHLLVYQATEDEISVFSCRDHY